MTKSANYEKTMWEKIETELEEINVENLGFNHPICSEQNHDIIEACKVFIQNEESKINIDEVLGNSINYGEWLDKPKELQDLTKRILESMLKVWKLPKYEAYIKKRKSINKGSYICEVLAPLLNIVMSDLPDLIAWDIWGKEGSSANAIRKGSCKIARRADYMMVAQFRKNAELEIVYLETGRPNSSQDKQDHDHKQLIRDVMELYAMQKESGIYKYCLIEKATILLHMTSPSAISDSGDSEDSSSEMVVTVTTPKNS
ncbi:hypothetical protein RclHR1_15220012 [Rhizophagus clarus]|uniref:Uncharacterized protein n=1 Tax=Rhizophagus clarus TaxID=94130 RepID=A0A2Z6QVE0_9GLOM|nr:hypothetical protein RclHR1_15220012 [Rhizophagus clarus]